MLKKLYAVYFSPTGGTKRAALNLAEGISEHIEEIDLSLPHNEARNFSESDVVLFAMPVFGGLIPLFPLEKLKAFTGGGARAITVAVYGNRAYDDALAELNTCVSGIGFNVAASAALIAEHSMLRALAAGRPDEADRAEAKSFAKKILGKLESGDNTAVKVPGNPSPEHKPSPPSTIVVSDACTKCGTCAAQCPTQAIDASDPRNTDGLKCFRCMRCVYVCPTKSRSLPAPMLEMVSQHLSPLISIRRENELYI